MSIPELVETESSWIFPLAGLSVTQLRVDYAFSLLLHSDDGGFEFRIGVRFVLRSAGHADASFDPESDSVALGPALALFGRTVSRAEARKDGGLLLEFADGTELTAPACPEYEAWTFAGPHGLKVVSLPGGGVAIWDADKTDRP